MENLLKAYWDLFKNYNGLNLTDDDTTELDLNVSIALSVIFWFIVGIIIICTMKPGLYIAVGVIIISSILAVIFYLCHIAAVRSHAHVLALIYYFLWQLTSAALFFKIALDIIVFIFMIIVPFIFYYIPYGFANMFKKKEYTISVKTDDYYRYRTAEDKRILKLIEEFDELLRDMKHET